VTVTDPPGTGDDDLVAQFRDPELTHGYAEYPAQPPVQGFPGPSVPEGIPTWGPAGASAPRRSSRRRLLALLIVVLIVAVAVGLVAGLAH